MTDSSTATTLKSGDSAGHPSESSPSAEITAPSDVQTSDVQVEAAIDPTRANDAGAPPPAVPNEVGDALSGNTTENVQHPQSEVARTDASPTAPPSDADIDAMMREAGWESRGPGNTTNATIGGKKGRPTGVPQQSS